MTAPDSDDLRERVARLERAVTDLRETVESLQNNRDTSPDTTASEPATASSTHASAHPEAASSEAPSPPSAFDRLLERLRSGAELSSEDWLSRVGIGLLLFGLAFLFKYSIDQGWLIPEVRVGFGAALGSVLAAAGLRLYDERRRLRQILLGGSSATFYVTVFAAFQLYALLPYGLAFASMVTITICTIALAIQQDEALLAVIGTAGGLGTPFLLYTETGGLLGLSIYLGIMLAGASAIFLYRGWRTLLLTTVAGGWLVLLVSAFRVAFASGAPADVWALQGTIGVAWLLLSGVPVARTLLRRSDRLVPAPDVGRDWLQRLAEKPGRFALVTASPFLALLCSRVLWDGSGAVWASVAGVGALIYAGAYVGLQRAALPRYAAAHGLVAAVLAAYGLSEALGGSTLLIAWTVEAVLLLALARRFDEATLRWSGHLLFGIIVLWLFSRLTDLAPEATPLVSAAALSDLVVIGAGLAIAALSRRTPIARIYQGLVLAGWLGWWLNELVPVTNGQAYVSVAWCATAAALLVAGTWRRSQLVQAAGLATLALFVGKLFLVDLASLPALGRILLFLGSGALFLLISYSLPGLITSESEEG